MSNIHGLASLNNNNNNDDDKDEDNRYVGGVSARGGGSGLAVEPNTGGDGGIGGGIGGDIFGTIRSNAEVAQPPSSSSSTTPSDSASASNSNSTRRMITMYSSGFTIDNGPFRRLDDPSNSDFLRDLARGVTPRELFLNDASTSSDGSGGDMEVGLVDKRHMEYKDDQSSSAAAAAAPSAFSGVGQSLGDSSSSTTTNNAGIISTDNDTNTLPTVDESKPQTTIQIRLINGKKLIVKCNLDDTIQTLVLHIAASADAGNEDYVLSSGYPPRVLDDLNKTIEECGLKNAQVVQKRA
jgi:UBX domain-containing protein 1